MLFTSIQFLIFMPIVFILYWWVSRYTNWQNGLLLIASCFFYSCWDWRFLGLLILSTLIGFFCGKMIALQNNEITKKKWLYTAVVLLLSLLLFFKYFNFFIDSFAEFVSCFGLKAHYHTLKIILPVGISFYTFHGISYVIDIYKNKIKQTSNVVDYGLFISFFPLLIAGPIERATHLLPQIQKKRHFNYSLAVDGLKQILWGFFKKIVIADSCARIVDPVFANTEPYNGSTYLLAAILFSIQIYADFSGYSDIAIGISKTLGFNVLRNFNYPYFSRNVAEFWRRWHISLTSWFRDYLYIPLGGSRLGKGKTIRNVLIVFVISGLWHGASWTFVAWGLLHVVFMLPSLLIGTNRKYVDIVASGRFQTNYKEVMQIIITFLLITFAWILFRSDSLIDFIAFVKHIFSLSVFEFPDLFSGSIICVIVFFFIIEWVGRRNSYAIESFGVKTPRTIRWGLYYVLLFIVFYFWQGGQNQFIYFQF